MRRLAVAGGVVGALVLVYVVAFGGDDAPAAIDTAAALASIDGLDESIDDERQESIDDELSLFVELDDCPTGDLSDVADLLPDGLDPVEDPGDELAWALTFTDDEDEPISYQCTVGTEIDEDDDDPPPPQFIGTQVGQASSTRHRSFVRDVLDGYDVEFGDDEDFRGGEIVTYCADPGSDLDGVAAFCEADWVGGGLQVGVYITTDDDQLPLVRDWLVAALDGLLRAVTEADGELSIAAGSS